MQQKKEEMRKSIENFKELAESYEKEGLNKPNKFRYYHSRIRQYNLLVEKTQMELDNLLSKFGVESGSAVRFFLARWGYYRKSINNLKEKLEYHEKLAKYQKNYDDMFCKVLD